LETIRVIGATASLISWSTLAKAAAGLSSKSRHRRRLTDEVFVEIVAIAVSPLCGLYHEYGPE
jgi:hypothetical protein